MGKSQWAGTTYGNGWMHGYLIRMLRHTDVRLFYLLAAFFIVPVCLIINDSRKTAYFYFREILGYGRWKSIRLTYSNHCQFAQAVIDKFAMYAGKKFDVRIDGIDYFQELAGEKDGFLMLSSHIGNYEIAGYSLVSDRKTINPVVYSHEKASVMYNRSNLFHKTNINMIELTPDMNYLFEINTALSNGNIVSMPADRIVGDSKCESCLFLGRTAKFPQGPFTVAAMRGLNVLAVNVMKSGLRQYTIYITPLDYDRTAARKIQIEQISKAYVTELENRLRQYPAQWYNFYKFWE